MIQPKHNTPKRLVELAPWQMLALHQPFEHFAMLTGIACGKTYTGSHFAIQHIQNYPGLTGFIGANSYDQLSQATLREFLYWLDHYQYEFVIDRKPPDSWNLKRAFKQYKNLITVKTPGGCTPIFTRTLSKGNPLRGIEFSWYWLDETRDTPENTHDVLLSRMRESSYRKGLITTTTNGYDWCHKRFIQQKGVKNPLTYGSMHVRTSESRDAGLITPDFYDLLRASYSPMMAAQELDALHVNANTGLAYYAAGDHNRRRVAPWGDTHPNPERPLILGCDFNYQPAPMVWMAGQVGPNIYNDKGELWSDYIHWFDEFSGPQVPTEEMAKRVAYRYPEFFIEVFGDSSGGQDTTSNAGDHDYNQMADVFNDNKILFTIHKDLGFNNPEHRKRNPLVKDRVEAMNSMFKGGTGVVRQTYNPDKCPLFDQDLTAVGWRTNVKGRGRLDSGGNVQLTHASDGAGYAVFKKFPPQKRAVLIDNIESHVLNQLRGAT